ncbi:MAG TPA: glycosyltransferase family 39 protein, partial [Patescibacteria group bacterium]
MFSSSVRPRYLLLILLLLAIFTRFLNIDWGHGYYFHPDENNMANAVTQLDFKHLDPHFYAYGQFPLYLTFFSVQFLYFLSHFTFLSHLGFDLAVLGLRFYSALFSLLSLAVFYLIGRKLIDPRFAAIFTLFLIFSPGLIQLAHFGTTESLLILVFALNIYFSLKFLDKFKPRWLFQSAIISGLGLGSKITAVFFMVPILTALLIFVIRKHYFLKFLKYSFTYLAITLFFFLVSSPYNLINRPDFLSSMNYETSVALGRYQVFYTNQFLNSRPFIFQMEKIFPYSSGLPMFIFGISGLIAILVHFFKTKKIRPGFIIIFIPSLLYFLYNGQLYTKWFRFMSPLFFIIPFLSAYLIYKLRSRLIVHIVIILLVLPGILFMKLYLQPDIRLSASNWLTDNLPSGSFVLSEAGNVVDIPLHDSGLVVKNFDFYGLDNNPSLEQELPVLVAKSDYILIPSRRMFKNQAGSLFPWSQKYYSALFSGQLGFEKIKQFSAGNSFILNPENAEETFSVFDSPTIRLYKKVRPMTLSAYT